MLVLNEDFSVYSFGDGPDVVGELAGALEAHIFEERLSAVAQ